MSDTIPIISCEDNLSRCRAECCKVIAFNVPTHWHPTNNIYLRHVSRDLKRYYEYHGVSVVREKVLLYKLELPPNTECSVDEYLPNNMKRVILKVPCTKLTENLFCSVHEYKPKVCQDFGEQTLNGYYIPKKCIYEVKTNGV